ncbi:MAG: hypothetical protein ACI8QC_000488 [Planctomycetota bacterium]|jgi:hypothetical protein
MAVERKNILEQGLDVLSSQKLAVVILLLMAVVTFLGTLDQVEHGLYDSVNTYFGSWLILQPAGPLVVPLPGAMTLMAVLAVNLFLGGLYRIKRSWRTAGVIVVHIGIVFLLLAGLVKEYYSSDGYLTLYEGDSSSEYVHYHDWEIAVYDVTETEDYQEWLIPGSEFMHLNGEDKREMSAEDLPLALTLRIFVPNARVVAAGMGGQYALPAVDGYTVVPQTKEKENEQNLAAMYVSAMDRSSGRVQEGILWSVANHPWVFEAGGKRWAIKLRHTRINMPFEVRLVDFEKEDHARTSMAASFSSDILRIEDGEETPVHIWMNNPLRYKGLILFQSGWGPQGAGPNAPLFSTFSVVENPSDQWPEYACWVIFIGMLIAFGYRLAGYIGSQSRARLKEAEEQGA